MCVLRDAISFEPDLIKSSSQPRLYYFESTTLRIHNLATQKNDEIQLPILSHMPKDFSYIQAHNTIYLCGGEEQNSTENGIFAYSNKTYIVDENSHELIEKCPMINERCSHRLNYFKL